nr:tRNA (adenosine(37)-N6)-threonylcarbamoyltransferase complex transferase subunit TsaD [Desulfobacterales bacterium]
MIVLGIETSCDETAVAVVSDGRHILSNVVASQIAVHHPYGGVVPELASRKHIEWIIPVFERAIADSGIGLDELGAVAVTSGPGLIGSLLVGLSFAKAFAYARKLPFVGVNHLEGHIGAIFLTPDPPPYPFIALLVSGGHTNLYYVTGPTSLELLGQTRDDAAGEAFDKVAKMLGLGYPGGVVIDRMAREGDPERIRFPRAFLDTGSFDFSFSGLKTAVGRYIKKMGIDRDTDIRHIAAGFQEAVVDVLVKKTIFAAQEKACERIVLVGGVASNSRLRERIRTESEFAGISVYIPDPILCTDNAAMIASVGYHHLLGGERSPLDLDAFSKDRRLRGSEDL